MESNMSPRKNPPPYISRADLRELLLVTGIELLLDEGLRCGLDHLTFPQVFERIEQAHGRRVTAGSVYDRLWHGQEEFQWEVLARLIEESSVVDERTHRRVQALLAKADRRTPDGRRAGLHKLCSFVVEQHVIEAARRQSYRILVGAAGAIASAPEGELSAGAQQVKEALRAACERETDLYVDLYRTIGLELGVRVKPPLELRQVVLAVGALADGVALRLTYIPEYSSIASFGVEAIAVAMLELDPDWSLPKEEK